MNDEIAEKLNRQINYEFYSAYLYLDFSIFYAQKDLNGFANWFRIQAQEERDHAMLIISYLLDNNMLVELMDIKSHHEKCSDLDYPLQFGLQHEQNVTKAIHVAYGFAMDQKDFRTTQFLDWFVREQCEEEKSLRELVNRFKLFGTDQKGLYLLDSELGTRTYTPVAGQAL